MRTHCPFCAAALPQTDDAFCSECRGRLDEAPKSDLVPAPATLSDVELRRRLTLPGAGAKSPMRGVWFILVGLWLLIRLILALARQ